jgi:hypothetical protein
MGSPISRIRIRIRIVHGNCILARMLHILARFCSTAHVGGMPVAVMTSTVVCRSAETYVSATEG